MITDVQSYTIHREKKEVVESWISLFTIGEKFNAGAFSKRHLALLWRPVREDRKATIVKIIFTPIHINTVILPTKHSIGEAGSQKL